MFRRSLWTIIALPACMGQMCGSPATAPPPQANSTVSCLTADDVTNIPPGNAVGTSFSGDFEAVSTVVNECTYCPSNQCEQGCDLFSLTDASGQLFTFVQRDGMLSSEGGFSSGGVNSDGTFKLGGIQSTHDAATGKPNGQVLLLFNGKFTGNWAVVEVTAHATANTPAQCDIQVTGTTTYLRKQ